MKLQQQPLSAAIPTALQISPLKKWMLATAIILPAGLALKHAIYDNVKITSVKRDALHTQNHPADYRQSHTVSNLQQPSTQNPKRIQQPFVLPTSIRHLSGASKPHHNHGTLTVVAVRSPVMAFRKGKFNHGFQYDLARYYAEQQDMNFKFVTVSDNQTALKWVASGKAQLALTTADAAQIESVQLASVDSSCGEADLFKSHGFEKSVSWVFNSVDNPLTGSATDYLCNAKQNGALQNLASFYDQQYLNSSMKIVVADIKERLPRYKNDFQQSAKLFGLDWQFLAAVGYQESYLKPESISPTGVRGLMMLTEDTAQFVGIQDREDPQQSIYGGAKFLYMMLEKYRSVPYPDRNWLALAAYNMGPGTLDNIRQQLKQQGQNPDSWLNIQQYMSAHQASNSRYTQAMQYVKRIRVYVEQIKTNRELKHI